MADYPLGGEDRMNFATRWIGAAVLVCTVACGKDECPPGTMMGPGLCKVPEAGKPAPAAGAGGRGVVDWPRFDDAGTGGVGGQGGYDAGREGGAGSTADAGADASADTGTPDDDSGPDAAMSVTKTCGNGLVDVGEACDSITCPTDCDTGNACIVGRLEGSRDECTATCKQSRVTECVGGDGCCAEGCNSENDNDCSASCGNDVVEEPETCDGDCPANCDDGEACTVDMQTGTAAQCSLMCAHMPAVASRTGDGCCPAGANVSQDPDCPHRCGDGVVTGGETCDPKSTRKCPAGCDDGNPCTTDTMTGSVAACSISCTHTAVAAGTNCGGSNRCDADGECVAPRCGDGVVDSGELCDGNCPTTCPMPSQECASNTLTGTGCQRRCVPGVSPAGTMCYGGRGACDDTGDCTRNIWYQGCVEQAGCFDSLTCQTGRTICSAECTEDSQCGDGGQCMTGWCEKPCNLDSECRTDQLCGSYEGRKRCRPKACAPGSPTNTLTCSAGYVCAENPIGNMVCVIQIQ